MEDYQQIYNSIARRAFEMFESEGGAFGRELEHWFKAESELLHPVYLEVTESPEGFNVSAEVPGFSPKDLEISVEPRRLTIVGKRETKEEKKKGKLVYKDRLSDQLLRIVDLPAEINTDKVKATLDSGVLMLEAPKAAPAKKIAVETKAA
ncbi:MAG TPA: Hsp20 family protein [Terriglobia bacterium]|nr:Hsp20 family protein [Terriglobia bacterium]